MKKKPVTTLQIVEPTQVDVNAYPTDCFTMLVSEYLGFRNIPRTPDAAAILNMKNIPFELAELLQNRVIEAMSNQTAYNFLLTALKNPLVLK